MLHHCQTIIWYNNFTFSHYSFKFMGWLGTILWPLVPEFAGSNPAEAVGIFCAQKNPQHAFLRRGS
jgi:hypothetical protein